MSGALSYGAPRRAALVVAHPGHELRVHGWLEQARPEVHVLTDGSGHGLVSRLGSTTTVLSGAGATPGAVYGRFSDRSLYQAMLAQRLDLLLALTEELSEALVARGVDVVVCDAIEGYNPSHDVCRLVTGAAVALAARRLHRPVPAYDFPLVAAPDACPEHLRGAAVRIDLDDAALARKLEAADRYPELRAEVQAALASLGPAAFLTECLRPHEDDGTCRFETETPDYEQYGARRVAAGIYPEVLTFRGHVGPIAAALRSLAGTELVP